MNILKLLERRVSKALKLSGAPEETAPMVKQSNLSKFGDYQCNAAMSVAKTLRMSPYDFASVVIQHLDVDDIVSKVEIAGPGFINITLSVEFLTETLQKIVTDERLGIAKATDVKTVVIDYSAPNVAKEMHVAHIRSTIIGDSIARILEFLGHKVIRQNHIGDWGTQFGMLIAYLEEVQKSSDESFDINYALSDLERFYKKAKNYFDNNLEFANKSRDYVVRLQSGDEYCKNLWRKLLDATLMHIEEVYERLNVSLSKADIKGESSYNDSLPVILTELQQKNLLYEDQGAKVVFLNQLKGKKCEKKAVIVEKSSGGYLYATTDLAAIRYRVHTLNADRILYFVDARQSEHFQHIYQIALEAGFSNESVELTHHPFGMMLGQDGKPFKTRAGGTIKLIDLLDEAEKRAAKLIARKNTALTEEQKVEAIKTIAVASVKYADLSKNRTSDCVFDWDAMLAFDGNTAPYLLYAYIRIQGIFRKMTLNYSDLNGIILIQDPNERLLALQLLRFNEVIDQIEQDCLPHLLCSYLYDLSGNFMSFYESCAINKEGVSESVKESRLLLCCCTAKILKQGLMLLGINTLEYM